MYSNIKKLSNWGDKVSEKAEKDLVNWKNKIQKLIGRARVLTAGDIEAKVLTVEEGANTAESIWLINSEDKLLANDD